MNKVNKIETKTDYILVITNAILLFIATKNAFPTYLYAFFAIIISFYFFPIRLIINLKKDVTQENKINLIATGLIFSVLLIFSILNLYIPNSLSFKYIIYTISFLNFGLIIYYYMKFNQFLLLNFIFGFITSLMV